MAEQQTYCDRCGRTFDARYDTALQVLTVWCAPCDEQERLITAAAWPSVPESERRLLWKLVERTAEANGEPVPTIPSEAEPQPTRKPLAAYPIKIAPLPLDWVRDFFRKSPTPSVGMVAPIKPMLSEGIAQPLMMPPVNVSVGRLFETEPDKIERIKRMIELLQQCQVKKP